MAGAEKLLVDLLPRLRDRGYDVELLLLNGENTPFRKQLEMTGIKVMHTQANSLHYYNPINLIRLIPYLKRYDIVHTHNTAPQLFTAIGSLFCSTPLCHTEHSHSNHRRKIKYYAPIDRWVYNRFNRIICISSYAEECLLKYLRKPKPKICTINNGVDISKYSKAIPSDVIQTIAPDCRSITMVANFRDPKDQDTIIRGLASLPKKFHLFLLGEGGRRSICQNLAQELGVENRVHFMGHRPDVPSLLRASDYIVMSSRYEGLSLSSVEGMCVGKPFLSSDVNGLREVVQGAGLLFPYQDDKKFVEHILRLENHPEEYNLVAENCYKRACDYDISKMVDSYSLVYQDILKGRK
jgi:glycosyltransferase involved in cell wall biosynthesis